MRARTPNEDAAVDAWVKARDAILEAWCVENELLGDHGAHVPGLEEVEQRLAALAAGREPTPAECREAALPIDPAHAKRYRVAYDVGYAQSLPCNPRPEWTPSVDAAGEFPLPIATWIADRTGGRVQEVAADEGLVEE